MYSRRSRYASRSPSPYRDSRSVLRSRSRSSSRDSDDVDNPGNNLYVTGLSPRIRKDELEKHFAREGKVVDIHLVADPWTRESRGFGFVTMASVEDADRCIKYLDRSVLEGRVITVEKARRKRGRTPTPGTYLGARASHVRQSPRRSLSPYRSYSSERERSYSPYYRRYRSRSPDYRCYRNRSRSRSRIRRRGYRSDSRSVSPIYRRRYYSSSVSPTARRSSKRNYSSSASPRPRGSYSKRYHSPSASPRPRRSYSKRYYSPSASPRPRRSYSKRYYLPSASPKPRRSYSRRSRRSPSYSLSPRRSKRHSHESYSHSCSMSSYSRSVSRSPSTSA